MILSDLVFWIGLFQGMILVLAFQRYLKHKNTSTRTPIEPFPMPSYSPFDALREDVRKLHGKFDELFKSYVTCSEKYKPGLEELSRKWAKPEVKPSIVPQADLKTSMAKVGLDKLTPVAKTKIADLDGETIYEDTDGRRVFSPTSVEIDGEKHPLLAGRTYMVDVNELRTIDIEFQAGNPAVNGVNGLTNELLLAILIDRTKVLDSEQPCEHNQKALAYMEMALDSFNARTQSRTQATMTGLPIDEVDKESHHH